MTLFKLMSERRSYLINERKPYAHSLIIVSKYNTKLLKSVSNVSGVTIKDGAVSVGDLSLSGEVEDDDLGGEVRHTGGGLVLGVGDDESSLDVLDRDLLDVEANVASGDSLGRDSWCISTDLTSVGGGDDPRGLFQ